MEKNHASLKIDQTISAFDKFYQNMRVTDDQRKVIESKIKKTKIRLKILWFISTLSSAIFTISLLKVDFKPDFSNSLWGFILVIFFFVTSWLVIFLIFAYKDIKADQWDLERDSFYDNLIAKSVGNLNNNSENQKPA